VRRINRKLPQVKKLRILAGDPPLDWDKVKDQSEVMLDRDANVASVMERKYSPNIAEPSCSLAHFIFFHNNNTAPVGLESAVQRYERNYPGVTLVIGTVMVFYNSTPPPVTNGTANGFLAGSVARTKTSKDTWLGDVNKYYFSEMVDAYLYLGPVDLILAEPRPAEIFLNKDYMAELRRRAAIIGTSFVTAQTDPEQISDKHFSPFLYVP